MAQVPEKVLSWLYSVLHEYHDPHRAYSDVARALATYPSLTPRTEVYTFDTGSPALLLTLSGTLPVAFRGTTYRFPVKLWIPHSYAQEAPMAYVTPGSDMLVRPGQHVGVDGRVYHPYLRDWSRMWDRASIAESLEYLQQAFAKEPPVISKAQQQQYHQTASSHQPQQAHGASPVPPQLPPKQRPDSVNMAPVEMPAASTPPPRPPKLGEEYADGRQQSAPSRDIGTDGPQLPPLPKERSQPYQQRAPTFLRYQNGFATQPRPPSLALPHTQGYQNGRAPGPSPLPPTYQQPYQQSRSTLDRSPVSPVSPVNGYQEIPQAAYTQTPPLPPQYQHQSQQYPPQQQPYYQPGYRQAPPPQQQYFPNQESPPQGPSQQPQQSRKQPPPDLLSDPFDVAIAGSVAQGSAAPAPPIPPNPEKEHLLRAISTTLLQQGQRKVSQNLSAIAPLQAQQSALRAAHQRLEAEIVQLESLDNTLSLNERILHRSIQDCDQTIRNAKTKSQPPIDDVLVAPTLVAQQLWTLCAEEAGCREAMYVLQKAVDRGRVSGNDFVRQMRALGRECFLKMVLARKCAKGLGLEMDR